MKVSTILFSAALLSSSLSFSSAYAAESALVAGEHYEVVAAKESDEPVLEEFFNYACGACYTSEKLVQDIKAAIPNLKVQPVPVELNPAWKIYVQAYYIGEKLGVLDVSHGKIFHRIHVERKTFKDEDDMKAFFLSLGVEEQAYDDVAKSYWLDTQVRLSKQYAMKSRVMATPSFLVNQRYKLIREKLTSQQDYIDVIRELSGADKPAEVAASE